jgi:hypothetical protein
MNNEEWAQEHHQYFSISSMELICVVYITHKTYAECSNLLFDRSDLAPTYNKSRIQKANALFANSHKFMLHNI